MGKYYTIIIIVMIACVIVGVVYERIHEQKLMNKLNQYIFDGDEKSFKELADDPKTAKYVKPFNLDYGRLTLALQKGKDKEIIHALNKFDQVSLTNKQKEAVYETGFKYAVLKEDANLGSKYYKLIMELPDNLSITLKDNTERLYDIVLMKGHKYLDEYLELLEEADIEEKPLYESYIAQMYANMNDRTNEEKYNQLVEQHLKEAVLAQNKDK